MAEAEPRQPRTLDEEIISAEQADVVSTLTDEDRIDRVMGELVDGFRALGHLRTENFFAFMQKVKGHNCC